MANNGGVNQFQGFQVEQPYGQIKRLQELVSAAPLPANSSLTAPARAQRKAARPQRGQPAPTPQAAAPPQPVEVPYPNRLAQMVAGLPGADGSLPNLTWLAQQAQKEAGG